MSGNGPLWSSRPITPLHRSRLAVMGLTSCRFGLLVNSPGAALKLTFSVSSWTPWSNPNWTPSRLPFGRSYKPEAKAFQDWVTRVVLPAIRKDGAYVLGEEKVVTGEMDEDELVLKALGILQRKTERLTLERDRIAEQNRILECEKKHLEQQNQRILPAAQVGDAVGAVRVFEKLKIFKLIS